MLPVPARLEPAAQLISSCYTLNHEVCSLSMTAHATNPNFMNGVPELLILRLLSEQEMYGYEIVQAIRERTGEIVAIGEGVVYPVLHGLEHQGALKSRRKTVQVRSRIYYSLTALGKRRMTRITATWESLAGAIGSFLGGRYAQAAD